KLRHHEREDVLRSVLAHEYVEMAVFGQDMYGVIIAPQGIEEPVGVHLALRQEAEVLLPGKERKSGLRLWRLGGEVSRQLTLHATADQVSLAYAARHLLVESHGHKGKFTL